MPVLRPRELTLALLSAFEACGAQAYLVPQESSNPRIVKFWQGGQLLTVKVYLWTMSFGGRESLPNEWRIQVTGIGSSLDVDDADFTVLMGYDPELQVFAGWNTALHMAFGRSPSLQIDRTVLLEALQHGLAFHYKDNDELSIAIRQDMLTAYVVNNVLLHANGNTAEMAAALSTAAAEPTAPELPDMQPQRKRTVTLVNRLTRDRRFRQAVLQAYDYRCAVSRIQLGLVQAAHIAPVASPASTDSIQNGIALAPNYHTAYDIGLIVLKEDYSMCLNERKVRELEERGWTAGMESFVAPLGRIHLPPQEDWYPSVENIRLARQWRGV